MAIQRKSIRDCQSPATINLVTMKILKLVIIIGMMPSASVFKDLRENIARVILMSVLWLLRMERICVRVMEVVTILLVVMSVFVIKAGPVVECQNIAEDLIGL